MSYYVAIYNYICKGVKEHGKIKPTKGNDQFGTKRERSEISTIDSLPMGENTHKPHIT